MSDQTNRRFLPPDSVVATAEPDCGAWPVHQRSRYWNLLGLPAAQPEHVAPGVAEQFVYERFSPVEHDLLVGA